VKAGAQLTGVASGHVRAPLIDMSAEHREELAAILAAGLRVLEDHNLPTGSPALTR